MFIMTANITVDGFKSFKPNSFKWTKSIDNYSDTCTVKIPALMMFKDENSDNYTKANPTILFKEGQKIEVSCGYDNNNKTVFKGFIKRINANIPIELECEGYSYQLRNKEAFSKSYTSTTVRNILQDLVKNTDIKIHSKVPQITVKKVTFKNASAIDVLEWLKDKLLLHVYFVDELLYAGLAYTNTNNEVVCKIGYNTALATDLKYQQNKKDAEVKIKISSKQSDGTTLSSTSGKGKEISKKVVGITNPATLAKIAEKEKERIKNRGYEGSITMFLQPYVAVCDTLVIKSDKYPERNGKYLCTSVSGEFGTSGGRVKANVGIYLGGI